MNTFFNCSQSFLVSNATLNWIIEDHKERNFASRPPSPLINMAIRLKVCLQSCLARPVQQVAELVIKVVILPFALIAWAFAVIRNQPIEGYKRYFKSLLINVIAAPFIVILSPCYGVAQLFLSNNLMLIPKRITNLFSLEERRGDLDQLHETAGRSTAEQSEIRGRAEEVEALIESGESAREDIIRNLEEWCSSSSDANKEFAAQKILKCFDEQNEVLNLSGLGLTSLPNCIGKLTSLTSLNLNNNQLTSLPEGICNLTSLTYLWLDNNRLNSLPEGIGELRALTSLGLGNNQLTSLPEGIRNLTSLINLYLYNNQLSILPEGISNLTSLTRLNLYRNRFTSLPEGISNLTSLTELDLYNNQLTSLPEGIGNLTSLTDLDLSENPLTSLPEGICNLTSLTYLNLGDNRLTSLPEGIGELRALTQLDLRNNQLNSLPRSIVHLSENCWIHAEHNPLTTATIQELQELSRREELRADISYNMACVEHPVAPEREEDTLDNILQSWDFDSTLVMERLALNEREQDALKLFLNRLRNTKDYQRFKEGCKIRIHRIISGMMEKPDFKRHALTLIEEACASCGDRVALYFNNMEIQYKLHFGRFKTTEDYCKFAIGLHRYHLLETIAHEKIRSSRMVDDVEVYLIYAVRLKEALHLPIEIEDMLYPSCSGVSDEEIVAAKESVIEQTSQPDQVIALLMESDVWKQQAEKQVLEEIAKINEEAHKKLEQLEGRSEQEYLEGSEAIQKEREQAINACISRYTEQWVKDNFDSLKGF